MYGFLYFYLRFMIYSMLGFLIETVSILINYKRISLHRGFFIGPYLPIFGFGGIIINYGLAKYENDLLALFILSMVFCTILEYLSSYILEKIFKLRWWNYYDKKFNLNGRVCLQNAIGFGVASIFVLKIFNPVVFGFVDSLSKTTIMTISIILMIIFIIDMMVTLYTLIKLQLNTQEYFHKDATKAIKKEIKENFKKHGFLYRRIFKSYPSITEDNKNIKDIENIVSKEANNDERK